MKTRSAIFHRFLLCALFSVLLFATALGENSKPDGNDQKPQSLASGQDAAPLESRITALEVQLATLMSTVQAQNERIAELQAKLSGPSKPNKSSQVFRSPRRFCSIFPQDSTMLK